MMKSKYKILTTTVFSAALIIFTAFPAIAHETYYFITNYGADHTAQNHPSSIYSSDTVQNYNHTQNMDIIQKIAKRFNINEQELRDYIREIHNESNQNHNNVTTQSNNDDDMNPEDEDNDNQLNNNFNRYHGDRYSNHLNFIDQKLTDAVNTNKVSNDQRRRILDKLQHNMASEENYYNARSLTAEEKQSRITSWKNDMSRWAERNGLTLSQLREITGKGNKYLMGVDY